MKQLIIAAELLPYCALGRLAEIIAVGLSARYDVRLSPFKVQEDFGSQLLPQSRTLLAVGAVPNMVVGPMGDLAMRPLSDQVVFTMWESDRLRDDCVAWLNNQRVTIVPTEWNRSVFRCSGVKTPIEVVPLGIDTETFCPDFQTFPKCVFLTAGRSAHGLKRKGLNTVILAFLQAFPTETDVLLQVKTHPDCPVLDVNSPRIQVIRQHLDTANLVRWYRDGLCYVSGATGEGWGLHQHEAMACGKPLIAVCWGGLAAFFNPKRHGYGVKYTLTTTDSAYFKDGRMAEPDIPSMAAAMRTVYENRHGAFLAGLEAAKDVAPLSTIAMINNIRHVISKYIYARR